MRALKGCCRRLCGKKLAGNAKQETPQSGAAGADGEWLEDAGWDDVEGGTAAPSVATPVSSTATTTTAPRSRGLRMDRAVARDKKDRVAADGARVGDGAVPINMQSNATEEDGDASELFASLGLDATYKRPKKHMRAFNNDAKLVMNRAPPSSSGRSSLLAMAAKAGMSDDDDDSTDNAGGWDDDADTTNVDALLQRDQKEATRARLEQRKLAMQAKREQRKAAGKGGGRFAKKA